MGGAVAVCIRFKNGKTVCQKRWTNPMPFWFKNVALFTGNREEYIEKYINDPDYHTKNKEEARHPIAPSEYGIIVIDFKTNHLLSMQYYTSLDILHRVNLMVRYKGDEESEKDFNDLVSERRLKYDYTGKNEELKKINGKIIETSFSDTLDYMNHSIRLDDLADFELSIKIDTKPLIFVDYGDTHNKDGILCYKAKLIELGFHLDEEALSIWNNYSNEFEQEEEDDDD